MFHCWKQKGRSELSLRPRIAKIDHLHSMVETQLGKRSPANLFFSFFCFKCGNAALAAGTWEQRGRIDDVWTFLVGDQSLDHRSISELRPRLNRNSAGASLFRCCSPDCRHGKTLWAPSNHRRHSELLPCQSRRLVVYQNSLSFVAVQQPWRYTRFSVFLVATFVPTLHRLCRNYPNCNFAHDRIPSLATHERVPYSRRTEHRLRLWILDRPTVLLREHEILTGLEITKSSNFEIRIHLESHHSNCKFLIYCKLKWRGRCLKVYHTIQSDWFHWLTVTGMRHR
jgi:hypothetical protein